MKAIKILEFDKILSMLSQLCDTEAAKSAVLQKIPADNLAEAKELQEYTIEADKILYYFNANPVAGFDDVAEPLLKAKKGVLLTFLELIKTARMLKSCRHFSQTIVEIDKKIVPKFAKYAENVYFDKELEQEIFFADMLQGCSTSY